MSKQAWLALGLVTAFAGGTASAAIPIVSFAQADYSGLGFDGAIAFDVPASDWGVLDLTADASASARYVNLNVDGVWRIQNMPFLAINGSGNSATISYSFSLGNTPGTRVESVAYGLSLSFDPLDASPALTDVASVDRLEVVIGTQEGPGVIEYVAAPSALLGDIVDEEGLLKDFPNQHCDGNFCSPAAVSNGLTWLNKTYGLKMAPGKISLSAMAGALGTTAAAGSPKGWWDNKAKYIKDNKLPVRQEELNNWPDAAAALKAGAALEINGRRKDYGHSASVIGLSKLKGGNYAITVAQDTNQKQKKASDLKVQAGVWDVKTGLITGLWGFDGDKMTYNFVAQYAEPRAKVPEPGTWAMLIAGFGLTGAAMRRRRAAVST